MHQLGLENGPGIAGRGGGCKKEQVALFNSTSSKQACRALHWVVNSIWNAAVTEYTSHIRRATPPRYPYTWLLYSKLLPLALLNADQVLHGLPLLWPFLFPTYWMNYDKELEYTVSELRGHLLEYTVGHMLLCRVSKRHTWKDDNKY